MAAMTVWQRFSEMAKRAGVTIVLRLSGRSRSGRGIRQAARSRGRDDSEQVVLLPGWVGSSVRAVGRQRSNERTSAQGFEQLTTIHYGSES